ncbi:Protein of unknown function [Lactobacillus helveticus CIRM-BIA 101]|nr:Protein of unknown function [Lactobacillus helveticus CIRM-BIA 101]
MELRTCPGIETYRRHPR